MNGSEFVEFMGELESMHRYFYIKHGPCEIPVNVERYHARIYWFIEIMEHGMYMISKRDSNGIGSESANDMISFARELEHDGDLSERFMNGIKEALEIE